ncbi:hypothetical protein KAM483_40600 [Aeromonas caviae]|nr:hypothetical protein KAM473_40660 [Aeromonas caviae]GKR63699.1 hypothetical protein KAM477_43210 [Aeromonas caviae]GKR89159.1 hypothetical protein KAM483_40600 [Aeromonas caviae]
MGQIQTDLHRYLERCNTQLSHLGRMLEVHTSYRMFKKGQKLTPKELRSKEGANKRGNSSRLTQSFHFFMFEPIFSPVNTLNQPI